MGARLSKLGAGVRGGGLELKKFFFTKNPNRK